MRITNFMVGESVIQSMRYEHFNLNQNFYNHTIGCQVIVLCARLGKSPITSSQCYFFSGPTRSMTPIRFVVENGKPLKPVLGYVKEVTLFIISHTQTQ